MYAPAIDSITIGSGSNGWTIEAYQRIRGVVCRGRSVVKEQSGAIFILFWVARSSSSSLCGGSWLFDGWSNLTATTTERMALGPCW